MKAASLPALFLVALLSAARAEADGDFGRLFFSPEERERLDRPPPPAAAPQAASSRPIRVDGIVRSSRGPATVWINGTPVPATLASPTPTEAAARLVDADGRNVVVHVGETYRPDTGQRETALPQVTVHAPASAR